MVVAIGACIFASYSGRIGDVCQLRINAFKLTDIFELITTVLCFGPLFNVGSWECLLPWGLVDTIISNPPYVFHEDMTHLAAEILRYLGISSL